jgi:hypothetical protein
MREHHHTRARRVKRERYAVGMVLNPLPRPALPCVVVLVRHSPGTTELDDDNLRGALKAVRDEVARWLKVDDADPMVQWVYHQRTRVAWGVTVMAQADDDSSEGPRDDKTDSKTTTTPMAGLQGVQGQGLGDDGLRLAGQVPRLFQAGTGHRH